MTKTLQSGFIQTGAVHTLLSFVAGTTSPGLGPSDSLKEAGLRNRTKILLTMQLDTMTARFFALQRKL